MRIACLVGAVLVGLTVCGCGGSASSSHQASGGLVYFTMPNPAMEPTIQSGNRVTVRKGRAMLRLGEVVMFHPPTTANPTKLVCGNINQGPGQTFKQPCGVPAPRESSASFVERIVGLPKDRIAVVNGYVVRNGAKQRAAYVQPCGGVPECDLPKPVVVPPGHYFLMGDNRGDANDSRFWGPIPTAWIVGTVIRR